MIQELSLLTKPQEYSEWFREHEAMSEEEFAWRKQKFFYENANEENRREDHVPHKKFLVRNIYGEIVHPNTETHAEKAERLIFVEHLIQTLNPQELEIYNGISIKSSSEGV